MQFRIKERKKREKQSKEKKFHSEENYLYYKIDLVGACRFSQKNGRG